MSHHRYLYTSVGDGVGGRMLVTGDPGTGDPGIGDPGIGDPGIGDEAYRVSRLFHNERTGSR